MSQSTRILCLFGIILSLPLVWLSASAVFDGAKQSKEQADCVLMSGGITDTIELIDAYYQEDARTYANFNSQNSADIEAQLAIFRETRVLDLRTNWHPVDRYFWAQSDLEIVSALCPPSELERQAQALQDLTERHHELAITTSNFVSEWEIE